MLRWCAIAALAGCFTEKRPGIGSITPVSGSMVLIGQPLGIQTSWKHQCYEKVCWDDGYHDGPIMERSCSRDWRDCEPAPYDVEVQCTGPAAAACPHGRKHVDGGSLDFEIKPLQPGLLNVNVVLYSGGRTLVEDTTWDVRVPDGLKVKPTVSAENPLVTVRLTIATKSGLSSLLEINGRPAPDGIADLAKLFPDRRVGDTRQVQPGAYELTVDVGAFHQVVSIEAVARGSEPAGPSPVSPY